MSYPLVTPWAVACQFPLSVGFSRHEYCSRLHFLLQGIFLIQVSNPWLPCLLYCRWILYPLSHQGSLSLLYDIFKTIIINPLAYKIKPCHIWLILTHWQLLCLLKNIFSKLSEQQNYLKNCEFEMLAMGQYKLQPSKVPGSCVVTWSKNN